MTYKKFALTRIGAIIFCEALWLITKDHAAIAMLALFVGFALGELRYIKFTESNVEVTK